MKKEDILVFSLGWLAANTPQLVQLLNALLPVIVVVVLGYAIHLIGRDKGKKKWAIRKSGLKRDQSSPASIMRMSVEMSAP